MLVRLAMSTLAPQPQPPSLLPLLLLALYAWSGDTATAPARILGVFPLRARSHFVVFEALMAELAAKGHRVTVYSPFGRGDGATYEHVSLERCSKMPRTYALDEMVAFTDPFHSVDLIMEYNADLRHVLACEPLVRLFASDRQFDLIVTESFHTDLYHSLGHKWRVPTVMFHSNAPHAWMMRQTGTPSNPGYVPAMSGAQMSSPPTFGQRLRNTLLHTYSRVAYKWYSERVSDEVAARMLGPNVPPVGELAKNASLLFTYTHPCLGAGPAVPLVPNVVPVAGLNIRASKPLPQDIERFINESKDGVVYFCMGSLLRGETFPAEKRNAFLTAFSKIPQRVLWKWEGDVLPGKSDDIMISKWMPQRDILAHPNVKLFISHGGLLGTSEAVYEGVPILGIPIFGDQRTNVKAIEANGAGLLLDYNDIGEEVVLEKIRAVLNDPKYKEKAKQLSDRYRDRPMSPLDTAVYWTEYVIRHKGAAHLRTAAVDMPWHQYLLLDVIAFLLVAAVSLLVVAYYACKVVARLVSTSLRRLRPRRRAQKEKRA